ncbi:anti-sigma-D factor RsdA [Mycobacterium sp. UM_CSW]|uniref:anti-sigma-D factor RsdA n=1 Tax=Mycobacterium sp. UM_CSW TaxID=1370119 RepID=UPI0004101CEC|nr:anti-sigma-D factor RsdA [Mycobacterium sp. UM_CSW]
MPESLDEFASTDLLLDALAERRPVDLDDPNDDALAVLLADWRDDLRWPPASALVSPEEAVGALHAGLAERRRARRGLAAIGSVAATLLVLSGFGAMVVEARPGDTLYGLHAMFFDQPRVKDSQIELSAKAELAKVQQMIDQGQWTQAQNQLAEVSSTVQSMNDGASRNDLLDEVNLLNTRVESRNPNATLPPAAPKPKAPAASSTSPAAPSTTPPSPSASSTTSPTTSPSSGRHRHHGHSSTPPSAAPDDTP